MSNEDSNNESHVNIDMDVDVDVDVDVDTDIDNDAFVKSANEGYEIQNKTIQNEIQNKTIQNVSEANSNTTYDISKQKKTLQLKNELEDV